VIFYNVLTRAKAGGEDRRCRTKMGMNNVQEIGKGPALCQCMGAKERIAGERERVW